MDLVWTIEGEGRVAEVVPRDDIVQCEGIAIPEDEGTQLVLPSGLG